jgi:hypothetical protein
MPARWKVLACVFGLAALGGVVVKVLAYWRANRAPSEPDLPPGAPPEPPDPPMTELPPVPGSPERQAAMARQEADIAGGRVKIKTRRYLGRDLKLHTYGEMHEVPPNEFGPDYQGSR